jgi:hypothetical protein
LGKSFLFYTEVYVEGDLMNCVYLNNGQCWAQPFAPRTTLDRQAAVDQIELYKPTGDEQTRFCTNTRPAGFRTCPRAMLYHDYLRARGLDPEKHN